jgi:hypothetical protein
MAAPISRSDSIERRRRWTSLRFTPWASKLNDLALAGSAEFEDAPPGPLFADPAGEF